MEANSEQKLLEHIDLYLDGLLGREEALSFEKKIKEDPTFASEVDKVRIARSIIKNYALRERLKFIHDEEVSLNSRNPFKGELQGRIMKIAAGLVLIISSLFAFQFFTLNHQDLFSNQFQSYQVEVSRGDDQSVNDPLVSNYMNGNYEDLININKSKPINNNETNFLVGNAYLNLHNPARAIESFEKIIREASKGGSSEFLEDAEYYIAMAYLELDKMDKAHWYFSKIYHDKAHIYHEKVSQLFYWKLKILKFKEWIFN